MWAATMSCLLCKSAICYFLLCPLFHLEEWNWVLDKSLFFSVEPNYTVITGCSTSTKHHLIQKLSYDFVYIVSTCKRNRFFNTYLKTKWEISRMLTKLYLICQSLPCTGNTLSLAGNVKFNLLQHACQPFRSFCCDLQLQLHSVVRHIGGSCEWALIAIPWKWNKA